MTTTHSPLVTGSPDNPASHSLKCNLGIYVFAAGAIFLGIVGLASGEFASPFQHFPWTMPFREPVAYIFAAIELAAGLALLVPKRARIGALTLALIYFVCALSWVRMVYLSRPEWGPGKICEQLSLALAALILFGSFSGVDSFFARHERVLGHLYGLCPIAYGFAHLDLLHDELIPWIPKWLPPSQMFWAYTTAICFLLAGAAILTGILAPLAARMLTAEIIVFELLVWIPRLMAGPHTRDIDHDNWAGNAMSIAFIGAAWVLADSISRTAKRRRLQS